MVRNVAACPNAPEHCPHPCAAAKCTALICSRLPSSWQGMLGSAPSPSSLATNGLLGSFSSALQSDACKLVLKQLGNGGCRMARQLPAWCCWCNRHGNTTANQASNSTPAAPSAPEQRSGVALHRVDVCCQVGG